MKRDSVKALCGAAVLSALCAVAPANANPITDVVNPADITLTFGGNPDSHSFVFDITDNGYTIGDTITSATVAIHFADSTGSEKYIFTIGAQTFSSKNVPGGGGGSTETITLDADSLIDLQADGMIDVTVSSTKGSFTFADATLTAVTSSGLNPEAAAAVPEPATLALLGIGLLGFARSRRKAHPRSE